MFPQNLTTATVQLGMEMLVPQAPRSCHSNAFAAAPIPVPHKALELNFKHGILNFIKGITLELWLSLLTVDDRPLFDRRKFELTAQKLVSTRAVTRAVDRVPCRGPPLWVRDLRRPG